MDKNTRNAAIAAAVIMAGFLLVGLLMPRIMTAVAQYSQFAAVLVPVLFVGAFFMIFWLRRRWKERAGE